MKSPTTSLKINLGLLISGLILVVSGLLIQFNYHMGNHGGIEIEKTVLGIGYSEWALMHKIFVIIFSFFMTYHIILHWRWFKTVVTKNLIAKNKFEITLSIVFFLAALTGYLPWLINFTGGDTLSRKVFIEIHDKITLFLIAYLILHVSKKTKWFITTFDKLKQ